MKFMIIETFRTGKLNAVYERFNQKGRLMPKGLVYINSWVKTDKSQCYQVVEGNSIELVKEWISHWEDLVSFQIIEVIDSNEAVQEIGNS